ncbi:MAG: hypothetical protein ACYTGG_10070 [Planctomycetota bacterium]|jgi:hypothetical protein
MARAVPAHARIPAAALVAGVAPFALTTAAASAAPPDGHRLRPSSSSPPSFQPETLPATAPDTGGAIAGPPPPPPCFWDNGPPADCLGTPASQFDPVYPFFAEAANDFILIDEADPDGQNPCDITLVTVWLEFFSGDDAPDQITGYHVTVYEDAIDPKGPAGQPNEDGTHTGALASQFIPASSVALIPLNLPQVGTVYQADVPVLVTVPKSQKLWITVAPEMVFPPQVGLVMSAWPTIDHPAQQIFALLGLDWTDVPGADCDGDGTPDDDDGDGLPDRQDLALQILGEKGEPVLPFCPGDCADDNKVVDIVDLLALLAEWGGTGSCNVNGIGVVDIVDLLALLANWGPCPTPANDECIDKADVTVPDVDSIVIPVDMRGATPSPENPLCTNDGKDVWYCLTFDLPEPHLVTITTSFDVFLELYGGCVCPPGVLKACAPGLPPFGGIQFVEVQPGQQCCLRLINDLGLPNEDLQGEMTIELLPGFDCPPCEPCNEPLPIPSTVFGDTTGAIDGLAQSCGSAINQPATGTDWYRVLGDGTTLTASTCNPGTDPDFDTQLSVFCGECALLLCVDGNDDDCAVGPFLASTVSWCSEVDAQYFIVVHGTSAPLNEGAYELTITSDGVPCEPPVGQCGPPNDDCANRIELPSVPDQCVPYDTILASTDGPDNPDGLCSDSGGVATGHDLWWNYQVPAGAGSFLTVDTCEDIACGTGDYDTDIVVYGPYASQPTAADCDPAALTANIAGCNDDALDFPCGSAAPWHSVVQIPVGAGEWYKIRVGGWQEGDLGTGILHVGLGATPIGACCVDGLCVGDLSEADCLAQPGCLFEWRGDGSGCATEDCTLAALPCDPTAVGGNGAADGINGVRPSASIGGWCNGAMGVAEDLIVCADTTTVTVHAEFTDLTSPIGTPSALDQIRVSIYDASGGVFMVDPSTAVPLCTIDASIAGGTATKAICGGPLFGGDVECWDVDLACAISAGTYLVSVSFPELGDAQYFIATGTPHPSSGETSQIWGIDCVDPMTPPVFGGPTGQDSSFCVGE